MSEIIEKTYRLLDALDNSEVIKNITKYKEKISHDEEVLSLIKKINESNSNKEKIKLKQQLYQNKDYKRYMDAYNELSYIVLKINKKYAEYTNTKQNICNN